MDKLFCFKSSLVHLEKLYFMSDERVLSIVRILYGDNCFNDVLIFLEKCSVGDCFYGDGFEIEVLSICTFSLFC